MFTVALAEDHLLMRGSIKNFINNTVNYTVVYETANGFDLLQQLNKTKQLPDIIVMDINMPLIDGVAVTYCLQILYPSIKVIGLSMHSNTTLVTDMIEAGAKGYILKENMHTDFKKALHEVCKGNIFIDNSLSLEDIQPIINKKNIDLLNNILLTEKEKIFLMYCASSLSYEQIAVLMFISKYSIYNYQKHLKEKLNINSREGLIIFALQHGLAKVARINNYAPPRNKLKK